MKRHRVCAAATVAMMFGVLGCGGSDNDDTIDSAATSPPETELTEPSDTERDDDSRSTEGEGGGPTVETDGSVTLDEATSTEVAPTQPVEATVITVVPETGVPGINSTDLFCRSWSEFGGTFQALALAAGFATDATTAQRAEVVASGTLVAAVAGLDEHLPSDLESERIALTVDLVGPLARRAERAQAELAAAGMSAQQIDQLNDIWRAALIEDGVDEPNIELVIPADLQTALGVAVDSFSSSLPPISRDPSLVTDAAIPITDVYLIENCPDQGTLGGNDIIDQP